jgi:hypothetical protein
VGRVFRQWQDEKDFGIGCAPVNLADAPNPRGASWGKDGNIVLARASVSGLYRVPDSGGDPEPLTKLVEHVSHRWPQVLPQGRGVLFTATNSQANQELSAIQVWVSRNGEIKNLVQNAYAGQFIADGERSGYLLYLHQGTVFAIRFDLESMELRGKPTPVLEDVAADSIYGGGQFAFSTTGTLIYLTGKSAEVGVPLVWLDGAGQTQPLLPAGQYLVPRLSPDGGSLALALFSGSAREIHVYDLRRQTLRRLTFAQDARYPTWTPDGKHIAFGSTFEIDWIRADGAGPAQQLIKGSAVNMNPYSFSPDGRQLSYYHLSETGQDLWTVALDLTDPDHPKTGKPEPFLHTQFNELRGAFSPDGKWMAYESDESGTFQIYVQPFPGPGGKWQISNASGRFATWSHNNKQLFFETMDGYIMVADYTVKGDSFIAEKPRLWSNVQVRETGSLNMTLHPDGKRFAIFPEVANATDQKRVLRVTFLLNFDDELRRRVPAGGK